MKPIIGIIGPKKTNEERPFLNYIEFNKNIYKRISEVGGIPLGLIFPDEKFIKEEADLCDGFVIQGGVNVASPAIDIIKYAFETKKPVLGICLGMQTIAGYEWILTKLNNPSYKEIDDYYNKELESEFLHPVKDHNKMDPFYGKDIEKTKHEISLQDGIVKNMFGEIIKMPSLHNSKVDEKIIENSKNFKITGRSDDGVIEVLESTDDNYWIVGVQFHPELEKQNNKIFEELIKKANLTKNKKNI